MEMRKRTLSTALAITLTLTFDAAAQPAPGADGPDSPPPPPAKSYPSVKLYGLARLDAAYATQRMFHPQGGYWALSPSQPGADEPEFVLYPRWSRLGVEVEVTAPDPCLAVDAKLEIDFNNGGTAAGSESRATPRMLHAYGRITMQDFSILGGQTSELIAPLNYGGMEQVLFWYGGNLGDRRPQLRASYSPSLSRDVELNLAVAAAQSGAVDMADLDADQVMDGIASARPALQGLAELRISLGPIATQPLRVGISGHQGVKRLAVGANDERFRALAGAAHLVLPVSVFTLQIEGYIGENLSDLRGGIGQGLELRDVDNDGVFDEGATIPAKGGFVQLQLDPWAWYSVQLGAGVDNPKGIDPDGRGLNRTLHFGNTFEPHPRFVVGAVYDHYLTRYVGAALEDGRAHRLAVYTMVPF